MEMSFAINCTENELKANMTMAGKWIVALVGDYKSQVNPEKAGEMLYSELMSQLPTEVQATPDLISQVNLNDGGTLLVFGQKFDNGTYTVLYQLTMPDGTFEEIATVLSDPTVIKVAKAIYSATNTLVTTLKGIIPDMKEAKEKLKMLGNRYSGTKH